MSRRKATAAATCEHLEAIPNVGPAMAADLRRLGLQRPDQLRGLDAFQLFRRLERASGQRQDPCVLDTLMAVTDFMGGAAPQPWWHYTPLRKLQYPDL